MQVQPPIQHEAIITTPVEPEGYIGHHRETLGQEAVRLALASGRPELVTTAQHVALREAGGALHADTDAQAIIDTLTQVPSAPTPAAPRRSEFADPSLTRIHQPGAQQVYQQNTLQNRHTDHEDTQLLTRIR